MFSTFSYYSLSGFWVLGTIDFLALSTLVIFKHILVRKLYSSTFRQFLGSFVFVQSFEVFFQFYFHKNVVSSPGSYIIHSKLLYKRYTKSAKLNKMYLSREKVMRPRRIRAMTYELRKLARKTANFVCAM